MSLSPRATASTLSCCVRPPRRRTTIVSANPSGRDVADHVRKRGFRTSVEFPSPSTDANRYGPVPSGGRGPGLDGAPDGTIEAVTEARRYGKVGSGCRSRNVTARAASSVAIARERSQRRGESTHARAPGRSSKKPGNVGADNGTARSSDVRTSAGRTRRPSE